jgi:quinol monooxygenase YgiN
VRNFAPTSKLESIRVIVIVNTTRITVYPEKRVELAQTITRLIEPVRDIKGCLTFGFYLDAADENSLLLISEWDTESDLDRYVRSNNFAILRGAIRVLSIRSTDSKALVTSPVPKPDKSLENVI